MTFGENLKRLRLLNNLTQDEVAEALQLSRQSISKWERDETLPVITFIVPLAKILNCNIVDLFETIN